LSAGGGNWHAASYEPEVGFVGRQDVSTRLLSTTSPATDRNPFLRAKIVLVMLVNNILKVLYYKIYFYKIVTLTLTHTSILQRRDIIMATFIVEKTCMHGNIVFELKHHSIP
jgi:hypothetical protein